MLFCFSSYVIYSSFECNDEEFPCPLWIVCIVMFLIIITLFNTTHFLTKESVAIQYRAGPVIGVVTVHMQNTVDICSFYSAYRVTFTDMLACEIASGMVKCGQ